MRYVTGFWMGSLCVLAGAAALLSPLATQVVRAGSEHTSAVTVTGHVLQPDGKPAPMAAVWLEAPGLHGEPLPHAVLDQRNKTFIPHVLVVTPGTKVEFPNNDTVFHNVFAEFEAKRFDLGMYPRGAKKVQQFDRAGVVSLLCNIHPTMSAFIVIADSPYRATTDKAGVFRLPDVPAGNYTVHVWHESGGTTKQSCVVGSATAPLTLTLNRP